MLVVMTGLSQFFRVSQAAIAPELMRDLSISPGMLSLANGCFFLALGVVQLPVGSLFDRYGCRRTITALTAIAVVGALVHAAARDGGTLIVARLLLGLGSAGSFMGAVVLCGRWFAGTRFTTVLSWVFALSNIGTLLATTPLAVVSGLAGWRMAFVAVAVLTVVAGALFWWMVRDAPPGSRHEHPAPQRLIDIVRGVLAVWRIPGLAPILAIHTFVYATVVTVLGLWAGPYLHDVHGLGSLMRGNILLAMALAQIAGILAYGPLDRWVSRKRIVVSGATGTIAVLTVLAAWPGPPVWMAATLLVLLCLITAYGVVIVAHGRSLFPDDAVGRGVTTVNLAQVVGSTLLPMTTGLIVNAFAMPDGGVPEVAYRLVFAALAGAVAAGLAVYSRARERAADAAQAVVLR
jgi:predicted MFS family arabinose efflux permease